MSPTSSRTFLTGRYARSAACRTIPLALLLSPRCADARRVRTVPGCCQLEPRSFTRTQPRTGAEPRLPWYVAGSVRGTRSIAVVAGAGALVVAGCGKRQDQKEPRGTFPVEITRATFPSSQ